MEKEEYLSYWQNKPWLKAESLYKRDSVELIKLPKVFFNTDSYVEFSKTYFDLADQDWEKEREYYPVEGNNRVKSNIHLGYGKQNTFVLNYGKKGDTNENLKQLFGDDNIQTLNLLKDSILMRLIVKFPGHGFAYHIDDASSYATKFSQEMKQKAKRLWIPITPWADGHMFQISDKIISNWTLGDGYEIPWGVPHLGVNFGLRPQFTLNITGVLQ